MTGTLRVLDLRRNKLNATIAYAFPNNCGLKTLALNQNYKEGYQNLWPIALGWTSWILGTTTSKVPSHFS
jgi:hypothetical protein